MSPSAREDGHHSHATESEVCALMRLLVTGGAGFIGSHHVRSLLTGRYPGFTDAGVTVFDKVTYAGNLAKLAPVADSPRYRFVRGDICDGAALPGYDAVVDFAAETHVGRARTTS